MYFTWTEELALNGHSIRLSVSLESGFDMNQALVWLDASDSICWSWVTGVTPPAIVTTGVELLVGAVVVQITVIAPPDDLETPLSDWRWSPSTVMTVSGGAPDLSARPHVQTEVIGVA